MIPTVLFLILLILLALFFLYRRHKKLGYLFWKPFAPPSIKLGQISPLPPHLTPLLEKITPSLAFGQKYFPCSVKLADGQELSCVYIIDAAEHANRKGELPLDFYPNPIPIEQVVDISESPNRLPQPLAQQLYDQGESGMGTYFFTVEFSNGAQLFYTAGSLLDFIDPPAGLKAGDAVRVIPHQALSSDHSSGLSYRWCIYRG
jgi:hypothetical protein